MSIKIQIEQIIKKAIAKLYNLDPIKLNHFKVDLSYQKDQNNYSTNIALILSKDSNKTPVEIAQKIIDNIEKIEFIEKINLANSGTINFYLNKNYLLNKINEIIEKNRNYGKNNLGNDKKINIQYKNIDKDSFKTINQARAITYADCLSRIMSFSGFNVTKEYYINNQNNNLTEEQKYFKEQGIDLYTNNLKRDLDYYRVYFDTFIDEEEFNDYNIIEENLELLKRKNLCYVENGSLWLKTTDYKDIQDKELITEDGNYTSFTTEISYRLNKIKQGFEEIIEVIEENNFEYIECLKSITPILNNKILNLSIIKNTNLEENLTIIDLIDKIGVNATRYFLISKDINNNIEFNINLALKQSNENPIYYIENTNAKIYSILKKYNKNATKCDKYTTLNSEYTYNILNKLIEFEDIIIEASINKEPYLIANYIYNLSTLFNEYCDKEKIITDDELESSEKMNLIYAIQIVINNALSLLGIIPREEM